MFICDLLLPGLRRDVLCGLNRLLHFLREFVDAHGATYETPITSQSGACFHDSREPTEELIVDDRKIVPPEGHASACPGPED
jgi:hypothetical protein